MRSRARTPPKHARRLRDWSKSQVEFGSVSRRWHLGEGKGPGEMRVGHQAADVPFSSGMTFVGVYPSATFQCGPSGVR
jgi:hypothetical protein